MTSSVVLIARWGVYHWKDFHFPDKEKNKFWIALVCRLVNPQVNSYETIPSLLPTHRYDKYAKNRKWLVDTVILEPEESRFFKMKTVIDLKNIFFIREEEVLKAIQDEKLTYKGILERNIVRRIEMAIRSAETLSKTDITRLLCERN